MVDSHCHLNDARFGTDEIAGVVERAREEGVETIICNGTDLESSKKAVEIAERFENIWATVGVHPEGRGPVRWQEIIKMTENPKVVGIGECGLDWREEVAAEEKERQEKLFRENIEMATRTGLPLVVHCREAFADVFRILSEYKIGAHVQMHCFTGGSEWGEKFIKLGCFLSFGGIVTYKSGRGLREVIEIIPDGRLLLETDSPYLNPGPDRKERNEPKNVKIIAETLADIRNSSINQIEESTSSNARLLFSKIYQ